MGLKDKIAKWFGYYRPEAVLRSYESAKISRLNWGWGSPVSTQDRETYQSLITLRARSRELARNNDYAKKFLWMVNTNIIGPSGIRLKPEIKNSLGDLDKEANDILKESFAEWGERESCSVDGKLSWLDMQRLAITSVARDGEILLRKIRNPKINKFGFALQVLEADYLDESVNQSDYAGKPIIRQGVEYDVYDKPIAYHLRIHHPGDYLMHKNQEKTVRVPAEEIIHVFLLERAGQSRGVPWMHTAMRRLNQVGEYEEAELVAARLGASQCGFFKRPTTNLASIIPDDKSSLGEDIIDAVPGTFRQLPPGVELDQFAPTHPTYAYSEFIKATLRGAAAGLLVSYANLGCDLRDVNYSSIRAGLIEERDIWRVFQRWMIDSFYKPVYREWLLWAFMNERIPYSYENNYERFLKVNWQPRGWVWVDPQKDIEASLKEIDNGLNSRSKILSENYGEDFEETLAQLAEEKRLAKEYDIVFETDLPKFTGQYQEGAGENGNGKGTGKEKSGNGNEYSEAEV